MKFNSSTPATAWYKQSVAVTPGELLTLRADVKLENLVSGTGTDGVQIRLVYDNAHNLYDGSSPCYGDGTFPLVVTSKVPDNFHSVDVYIGFTNSSGTAYFDGIQLEKALNPEEGYSLSSFNSVENGGFENGLNFKDTTSIWHNNSTSTSVVPSATTEAAWGGTQSTKMSLPLLSKDTASMYQDVSVYSGELLTFSGMVQTDNVSGGGAYFKIEYYNSTSQTPLSSMQTASITGTNEFTRLSGLATAPTGAYYARVTAILKGSGTAYFDDIKLIPRNSELSKYNDAGNYVLTSEDALGNQNNYVYNEKLGTLTSSTDALNHKTTYTYDDLNRLIAVHDPLTNDAYYNHDGDNNLTASRDPRSTSSTSNTYKTTFDPNALNQLGALTDPLGKITSNTYDRSGNLTRVVLPNSLEQNYIYDSANRLFQKTLDGGTYFKYTYDGANNLITVTDKDNKGYT